MKKLLLCLFGISYSLFLAAAEKPKPESPCELTELLQAQNIDIKTIPENQLSRLREQARSIGTPSPEIEKLDAMQAEKARQIILNFHSKTKSQKSLVKMLKRPSDLRCLRMNLFHLFLLIQQNIIHSKKMEMIGHKIGKIAVLNIQAIILTPEDYFKLIQFDALRKTIHNKSLYDLMEKHHPIEELHTLYSRGRTKEFSEYIINDISYLSDFELGNFAEKISVNSIAQAQHNNPELAQFIQNIFKLMPDDTDYERKELQEAMKLYERVMKFPSSLEDKIFTTDDGISFWILPETFREPRRFIKINDKKSLFKEEKTKKKKKYSIVDDSSGAAAALPEEEVSSEEEFDIKIPIQPTAKAAAVTPACPERSGHIKFKSRILDWFISPERALLKQGYRIEPFKQQLVRDYGEEIIIQNHRFPRSLDTLILFSEQYGQIEPHPEHNCYQLTVPGYIQQEGQPIQFGQYEYSFEKKSNGTRIIFHRFFRPMTPQQITQKFTTENGWHIPKTIYAPIFTEFEKSEIHTNQDWHSAYEQEGWAIDEDSSLHYTLLRNPGSTVEYGIQRKIL